VATIQKHEGNKTRTMIQTNHGKEPWQYLEQIADVHVEVAALSARVDAYVRLNEREHEEIRLSLRQAS
jgi:hypothetical protein